jgi:N-acetylneuraminate synthase/N,N'-diacetyllegionaminate synthase
MSRMTEGLDSMERIGEGRPCFIIAEAGVNHNGSLDLAHKLIDAAVSAGASAVKFQTFCAERVVAAAAPKAAYQQQATGAGESQQDMLRGLELPPEAFTELAFHCRQSGIVFLSTPFDLESVEVLDKLGVEAFKLPSGEITNPLLLRRVAAKGRLVILSTGMSTLSEVARAVEIVEEAGCKELALLHCTSCYPAPPQTVNLRAMATLAQAFHLPVGYSDHTTGIDITIAAVALGATIVEKHFTLDKGLPGPDHQASLDPEELRALVTAVRRVELALGDGRKRPQPEEANTRQVARRSLFAARDIVAGSRLAEDDLMALRPAGGIPPTAFDMVLGRGVVHTIPVGTMLAWSDLA